MVDLLASAFTSSALEARLGHRFVDPDLLRLALTHRSWCAEHPGEKSNERLEFLGDAVLGMVVTHHLFAHFPQLPEGQLAKAKAAVVSAPVLAEVGESLELGADLRLGKGEDSSGGREKASILADAVEAVIGAVFVDGGLEPARALILTLLDHRITEAARMPGARDYKTRLQEVAARDGEEPPVYEIAESGPDHNKQFRATVSIGSAIRGEGVGTSKKEAEQRAARSAWDELTGGEGATDV